MNFNIIFRIDMYDKFLYLQYIISGSDDFNIYVWKIPEISSSTLMQEPITVDRAFLVLSGHRSIVNQVRFNPATCMIISAGVEKIIKVKLLYVCVCPCL